MSQLDLANYGHLFPLVTTEDVYQLQGKDAEALFHANQRANRRQSSIGSERKKKKKVSFDSDYEKEHLELQEVMKRVNERRASGQGPRPSAERYGQMHGHARKISASSGGEYGPMRGQPGQARRVSFPTRLKNPSLSDEECDSHRGSMQSDDSAYNTVDSVRMSSLLSPATSPRASLTTSFVIPLDDSAYSTLESIRMSSPSTSPTASPQTSLTSSSKSAVYPMLPTFWLDTKMRPSFDGIIEEVAEEVDSSSKHDVEDAIEESFAASQKNRRSMMPLNAANLLWLRQLQLEAAAAAAERNNGFKVQQKTLRGVYRD